MRPLSGGALRAPGRFFTSRSVSRTSLMRSKPTAVFDSVSVIFDKKTSSEPADISPASTSRAPYHSTRQVPAAVMTSTMGVRRAFMARARSAVSTLSRLSCSKRLTSKSSRANAWMTRIEASDSCTTETTSPSFLRTSRAARLMRRVKL